jgi:tetratricopeptide (TPR) repeat protein
VIRWGPTDGEGVAPPAQAEFLLGQATAANPRNAALHARLAALHLDRYDHEAAAASLEAALRLDPAASATRSRLAGCYNILGQPEKALNLLGSAAPEPDYERGLALLELGRLDEAEEEFRRLLIADPNHRHGFRRLSRLLHKSGRIEELESSCAALNVRGVAHSQLLLEWGRSLAMLGETDRARGLLLDPERIVAMELPLPPGFADLASFNRAAAEAILGNPYRLSDFTEDDANRGSSRVHALFSGPAADLFRALLASIRHAVEAYPAATRGDFDPWARARPAAAHLKAWGLIQKGGDYEAWHLHRGGWLSGVYYARVPECVSEEGEGLGCIEYGPPSGLGRLMPDFLPPIRRAPREGMLLLAPSHVSHRTIPTGLDEYRISFAFDVVPDACT